ncbi:hypothetical protein QYZ88_017550 [Lachnospiraceae bacterium C1.1]|nr:hypothetical protein [Lachnospiraceae bacterium C1.1]
MKEETIDSAIQKFFEICPNALVVAFAVIFGVTVLIKYNRW